MFTPADVNPISFTNKLSVRSLYLTLIELDVPIPTDLSELISKVIMSPTDKL